MAPPTRRAPTPPTGGQRLVGRLLLALASAGVALCAAEVGLRWSALDRDAVRLNVIIQAGDLPVYRQSADPFLRYELLPGASATFDKDGPFTLAPYTVHVNSLGARGPERPAEKRSDTYRILFVGGSTIYGIGANDNETIPARLEAALSDPAAPSAGAPRRVEVWNFGGNGMNLSQAARLATTKLSLLRPDVVVVQGYNKGPRMVLGDCGSSGPCRDLDEYRVVDPDFILDYFPPPLPEVRTVHEAWFRHSALYRYLVASLTTMAGYRPADSTREREAAALVQKADEQGADVLFVAIPADELPPGRTGDGPFCLSLDEVGREPEYYKVHPPVPILDEFARAIAAEIRTHLWSRGGNGRRPRLPSPADALRASGCLPYVNVEKPAPTGLRVAEGALLLAVSALPCAGLGALLVLAASLSRRRRR